MHLKSTNFFDQKLNNGDRKTLIKPVPYFTISGVYENLTNKNSFYCYVFFPIHRHTTNNHGVIIAKLNMKDVHNLMKSNRNEAIESILIKRNISKYIQISPDKTSGNLHINSARFTPVYNHKTLIRVKEHESEKSKLSLIEHGEWCVLTIMHESILFRDSNKLLRNIIILSIAFTLLIIVFFIFYTKALIINPINKINNTLFDVTNGKFTNPIHYSNNDELSTTFSAINLVNSRLLKAQRIINNLVDDKVSHNSISKDDQ